MMNFNAFRKLTDPKTQNLSKLRILKSEMSMQPCFSELLYFVKILTLNETWMVSNLIS